MSSRERTVPVYIPVVPSTAGVGGVGPVLIAVPAVAVFAVLVAVLVAVAYPAPKHTYYPRPCDPFCPPASVTVSAPPAQFPFGGELR